MNPIDDEVAWLHTQLTVARWHLDAAVTAPIEMARRNIERARQSYDVAREALAELSPTGELHERLSRELKAIRERLQAAGAKV